MSFAQLPRRPWRFGVALLAAGLSIATVAAAAGQAIVQNTDDEPIPPQVQSSVDRGLAWLATDQDPRTGAWPTNAGWRGPTAAVTGLAAMAFMARGNVPGQGPYGDVLNRAVDCLLNLQQPDGLLASQGLNQSMYDHGIATVMLCECYGMLDNARQARARVAIAHAVRLILDAQSVPKSSGDRGGWRYMPRSRDSQISVSGWQLMALRGAANAGAAVPKSAIDAGIAYIKRQAAEDGAFRYGPSGHETLATTGTGILALELLGQNGAPEAVAGGDYLMKTPLGGVHSQFYFYTVYYCSQAAYQLGGRYWAALNPEIRHSILQRQRPNGSWSVSETNEQQGGDAYGTAMSILALTVPYRYLPIYQR